MIDMTRVGTGAKNKVTATMVKYDYRSHTKNKLGKKVLAELRGADVPGIDRMSLDTRLEMIEVAARHRDLMERRIASVWSDDPMARLLMTVSGISHTTAIGMTSEMAGIGRFPRGEKLAAYAGIVPSHRNSGEAVRGGITRTGSTRLRRALVNPATAAVCHVDIMRERYMRISAAAGRRQRPPWPTRRPG